jgi:uncharacterized protein
VLTTADGEKVIVWHVPAKPGRPVILYFHGNGDFLAGFFVRFRDMIADGTGVVTLSYRGYFGSSGRPSEQGLLSDAAAAYAFTKARYSADRIVAWGFSLGTGVASAFPIFPVRLVIKDPFHSDQRIARVKVPLLVLHGVQDPTIPIAFGERLFALANEPKKFVRFDQGGHNDLDDFGAAATARQFIGASKG